MQARVGNSRRAPLERMLSRAQAPSPVAWVLALQRTAGNRAVTRVLQRAPSPIKPATERMGAFRRGITRAQELRQIADALIEQQLGSRPARGLGSRRNGLAEIARRGGPSAEVARRLGGALAQVEADLERRGREVVAVVDDLIESRLGARPKTPDARDSALRTLRGRGGDVGEAAATLERQLRDIEDELNTREPRHAPAAKYAKAEKVAAKSEKAVAEAAAKPPPPGGKVDKPPAKPPPAPAKPPPAPGAKAPHVPSGTTAGKVGGEVVEEVASKGRVWGRVAAKIGIAIVDGLIPDPTDAIALMIKYAESFKAAQEAVRKRNLEKGFAVGWACYLLFPRWERARTFARTEVSKDVITQIIDAVGIAENAFNEGLVRGFIYGEKHSRVQLNGARQRALDAVHRSGRTVNGDYLGDGVYQFVRDDVYLFAGTLLPAARKVIEEAEARKELRERIEDLHRRREQIDRDFLIDMARK